ncbi:hypothetical protein N0V95_005645 [Ascochyta clinopodiicola]|nr:hypothetical protein N0V95_005645 [Ascochyta clinopodiicola]
MTVKISLGIFFARIVVAQSHLMLIYVTIVIWNSNMDKKSKFSVAFILCLAASACICSMIRFQYVDGLTQIDDFFWNATNIAIWSTIECGASIIAGCMATLRPLLKRVFATAGTLTKSLRSSHTQSNASSRQTNDSASASSKTHHDIKHRQTAGLDRDKPTFAEFIAEPGEVIEMSSDAGGERGSQDCILRPHEEPGLDFPWPVKVVEHRKEPERTARMHPSHKSWTSRQKIAGDTRTVHRPSSAPSSPGMFEMGQRYT